MINAIRLLQLMFLIASLLAFAGGNNVNGLMLITLTFILDIRLAIKNIKGCTCNVKCEACNCDAGCGKSDNVLR